MNNFRRRVLNKKAPEVVSKILYLYFSRSIANKIYISGPDLYPYDFSILMSNFTAGSYYELLDYGELEGEDNFVLTITSLFEPVEKIVYSDGSVKQKLLSTITATVRYPVYDIYSNTGGLLNVKISYDDNGYHPYKGSFYAYTTTGLSGHDEFSGYHVNYPTISIEGDVNSLIGPDNLLALRGMGVDSSMYYMYESTNTDLQYKVGFNPGNGSKGALIIKAV